MNYKQFAALALSVIIAVSVFAGCSKKPETTALKESVTQVTDSDDTDTSVVTEKEKSNIIMLKDEQGNSLSLIPIMDVKNSTMIAAYVQSATDKNNKNITDKSIVGKVIAITADVSSGTPVYSVTIKDKAKVFLNFYTNDKNLIVTVQSATDGKYYEVTSKTGDGGNIYMQLTPDSKGNPIEVLVKKEKDGKISIKEKATGKSVAKSATKSGKVSAPASTAKKTTTSSSQSTTSKQQSIESGSKETTTSKTTTENNDKVVMVTDYSSLADINIVLTKNSTASIGLDKASPVNVATKDKAYVKSGVLYINGNGDYYITQDSSCSTWYGKIVCTLGTKGLARVRLAGVNVSSSEANAIEFIDKDSVINDTEPSGEVLISYNNTSTKKDNPDAVLSFSDGTKNTLTAGGNANKGAGTIYSQCKLSIKGHGTAIINSKNKNGIQAARSVGIQNVTMEITANAGKGIRANGLLDIEEGAKITVNCVGDAIRCEEFLMDTDVKTAKGDKDLSTGSTVNLYPTSSDASPTSGDGIDADDNVIVRAGKLTIDVNSVKEKYGIKVRRVDNEEFLKIIKDENITDIQSFKSDKKDSPYYANVILNEKEYTELVKVKGTPSNSADYQGIRTSDGCEDTLRFTGGTTKVKVKLGRNTSVKKSTNSICSISAYASVARTVKLDSFYSSGSETVKALLYAGSDVSASKSYSVTFGAAGKRNPAVNKSVSFDKTTVGYASDI